MDVILGFQDKAPRLFLARVALRSWWRRGRRRPCVTAQGNANCEIQHTAAMVSTVEQQRPVVDPQALTTEDKPSASSSGWGQRQSRSGAELWFGAKLSFGLRLAGFARLAPVLQHGLIIHTGTAVRAMALTRPGTRTRSALSPNGGNMA